MVLSPSLSPSVSESHLPQRLTSSHMTASEPILINEKNQYDVKKNLSSRSLSLKSILALGCYPPSSISSARRSNKQRIQCEQFMQKCLPCHHYFEIPHIRSLTAIEAAQSSYGCYPSLLSSSCRDFIAQWMQCRQFRSEFTCLASRRRTQMLDLI